MTHHSPEMSGQILKDNPYGETVRELIDNGPHFNTNQLIRLIEMSLIKEVADSAEKGELFSQYEDPRTKELKTIVFSSSDIFFDQIATALESQDAHPKDPKEWGVNIPRANGLRSALMAVMQDKRLAEPFRLAVYRKQALLTKESDEQAHPELITGIPEALQAKSEILHEKVGEDLGEEAVEASGVEVEARAASRIVSLDQKEAPADPYDYLRTALPPVVPGRTAEVGQQRTYYDRFVTKENRQVALSLLESTVKASPDIGDILSRYALSPDSMDAVDAIRENPDVRFEVAKFLVQKLDRLLSDSTNDMGWRINNNSRGNLKVDPITGKRMTSRLYAVDMALKMIGGEFAEKLEGRDDFQRGPDGVVTVGQHRHAARSALLSYY